jgi:hypothetical protein
MSDETKPQDDKAMPPASAGSHGKVTVSLHTDDSACAFPDSRPIRRQRFTLTDAERALLERVRGGMLLLATLSTQHSEGSFMADAAGIGAILERTK